MRKVSVFLWFQCISIYIRDIISTLQTVLFRQKKILENSKKFSTPCHQLVDLWEPPNISKRKWAIMSPAFYLGRRLHISAYPCSSFRRVAFGYILGSLDRKICTSLLVSGASHVMKLKLDPKMSVGPEFNLQTKNLFRLTSTKIKKRHYSISNVKGR